jgi:hypothetical protein
MTQASFPLSLRQGLGDVGVAMLPAALSLALLQRERGRKNSLEVR